MRQEDEPLASCTANSPPQRNLPKIFSSVANSWQMFSAKSTKKFGRTQYPCIKAGF
jgi:hypothetical protein